MSVYNIGSSGDEVRRLQEQLNQTGNYGLVVDGQYGPKTQDAVRAYQQTHNLKDDGIAGPITLGSLYGTTPTAPSPTITNTATAPDITGLTGFRDYGTGRGLDIGWSKDTGPTVNNTPIDTSGLTLSGDKHYGSLDQLNNIFDPFMQGDTQEDARPTGYQNMFDDQTKAALERYLNPTPFNYDHSSDPSFKAYEKQYTKAGDRAFQDTIGGLSTLTGGRMNSWATSAASQARNNYMQDLTNMIPQLESQAYNRHQNEYNNLANQLNVLQNMDITNYGRHRDEVGDIRDDRNYNRDVFESDRTFDHKVGREQILDERYMREFDYQKQQDMINNALRNRQISVSEANAALNRMKTEYDIEQSKKADEMSQPPTPGQLANYNEVKERLFNPQYRDEPMTPDEMLRDIEGHGKQKYIDLMGENLYSQLVSDVYAATQPQAEKDFTSSVNEYSKAIETMFTTTGVMGNKIVDYEGISDYLDDLISNGADVNLVDELAKRWGLIINQE